MDWTDKQLLDAMDYERRGYGGGWIFRDSSDGRGMRLHESSKDGTKPTVREAIIAFLEAHARSPEEYP